VVLFDQSKNLRELTNSPQRRNPFIEITLQTILNLHQRQFGGGENCISPFAGRMLVEIKADNDFYSQRDLVCRVSVAVNTINTRFNTH
jgi:hypothetical protein